MQKKNQHFRHLKHVNLLLAAFFILFSTAAAQCAGLSYQGPTGFIMTPSHLTVPEKQVDMAIHTRMYNVSKDSKDGMLTSMALTFSPFRNAEFGLQKTIDSEANAHDPDPTVNFKILLPPIGEGEFSQIAFGGVFDANPNNYHTLYLSVGGLGVGWNFGGNPGGMANYGKFKKSSDKPESVMLLIGAELPERVAGERGYKSRYYLDYNGDVFSLGWRYSSHRGFWAEAAVQSKTSYDDFYDYKPFILGLGANF
ncbi:MAG: hypothetical protein BWY02_00942 [bacterium ADurb.Bin157]|nr:MAG: hypothetical protein BWY02_00942 [bacterium ADurb.Bin157]